MPNITSPEWMIMKLSILFAVRYWDKSLLIAIHCLKIWLRVVTPWNFTLQSRGPHREMARYGSGKKCGSRPWYFCKATHWNGISTPLSVPPPSFLILRLKAGTVYWLILNPWWNKLAVNGGFNCSVLLTWLNQFHHSNHFCTFVTKYISLV